MKIMIMGPQGSGKGTYASRMAQAMGIPHISTGQIFRDNIAAQTPLGKEVERYVNQGALVPDEITMKIVKDRIEKPDCEKGFIFDGFPRNLEQARQFEKITPLDVVVYLDVPKEILTKRLSGRRTCKNCSQIFNIFFVKPKKEGVCDKCEGELIQRADETPDAIAKRLEEFEKSTKPLVDFYQKKGSLKKVEFKDHNAPPEVNTKVILEALGVKK
jgi:adenylate kinase